MPPATPEPEPAAESPIASVTPRPTLSSVAVFFLKLGTTAFGGPAAHIALMEDELVCRRRWVDRQEFLDLLGAANLLPGPSSTELAIYIGYRLAGVPGLLCAGVCFILPAALMVGALAWAYVRWGHLPQMNGLRYGVQPAVIAVVLQALWRLGKNALRSVWLAALSLLALVALMTAHAPPLTVLLGAGGIAVIVRATQKRASAPTVIAPLLAGSTITVAGTVTPITLKSIFFVFLKFGSVVFGSGYVLLAFLRGELVNNPHRHWLTDNQLLDAVAVGQITPGPVFTTATFVGFLIAGAPGAAVATLGIFLPAFFFVFLSGPLLAWIRGSVTGRAFLDGLNAASVALMLVVTVQLTQSAVTDAGSAAILTASAVLLLTTRLNAAWIVAGAAVIGLMTKSV